jgi:hypothetical protein
MNVAWANVHLPAGPLAPQEIVDLVADVLLDVNNNGGGVDFNTDLNRQRLVDGINALRGGGAPGAAGVPGVPAAMAAGFDPAAPGALRDGVHGFALAVHRLVGYQPVPQAAVRNLRDRSIDTSEGGYVGEFLKWGSANVDGLLSILYTVFDHFGANLNETCARAVNHTCTDEVDIAARAQAYLLAHPPGEGFGKYLVKPTEASPDHMFTVIVPRYRVTQLVADRIHDTQITPTRMRALQRGFDRMEQLNTALIWIKHIREEVAAARDIIRVQRATAGENNALSAQWMDATAPTLNNVVIKALFS